jgi:membrane-associated phospholipid phosphatase
MWLAAALPRWRIGLILGITHVALMCVTVVVTGNHYVLDIVGGFAVAGFAVFVARFFPIELVRTGWNPRHWYIRKRSTVASTNAAVN